METLLLLLLLLLHLLFLLLRTSTHQIRSMPARWDVEVDTYNHSVISRIMLRFRPIAPKPTGSEATPADQDRINLSGKRTKRKYVRVRGRTRKSKQCVVRMRKMKKTTPTENSEVDDAPPPPPVKEVVTLQLLPERSEENNGKTNDRCRCREEEEVVVGEVNSGVIQTWIIVESVTEKFSEGEGVGVGFWDMERIKELERDTCPGMVTDGTNKVVWVNEAYKRMVGSVGGKGLAVGMVVQGGGGELPRGGSFACRVRIVEQGQGQGQGQGQKWKNRIVPCDVWSMGSSGGFAWKLDVNTALTLSLYPITQQHH